MASRREWEYSSAIDGVGEVRLRSWRYFFNYIYNEMLDHETYIWRGQRRDDWPIESTIDRLKKKAKVSKTKSYKFEEEHLEQFKYATRGRRGSNPSKLDTENEWWALGQHYGLATPLLDWTTSPFVAAYFAFIGIGEKQTKYRAVYALHKPSIEDKVKELVIIKKKDNKIKLEQLKSERKTLSATGLGLQEYALSLPVKPDVEFIRPLSDENQRLVNQGGLFSRFPSNVDVQSWVKTNFKNDHDGYTILKILIPNKHREECLKSLNRMNINHLTLFPDLYGASRFCNIFGEIEKY